MYLLIELIVGNILILSAPIWVDYMDSILLLCTMKWDINI